MITYTDLWKVYQEEYEGQQFDEQVGTKYLIKNSFHFTKLVSRWTRNPINRSTFSHSFVNINLFSHGGWVVWDTTSCNQSSTDPHSNPTGDYIEAWNICMKLAKIAFKLLMKIWDSVYISITGLVWRLLFGDFLRLTFRVIFVNYFCLQNLNFYL